MAFERDGNVASNAESVAACGTFRAKAEARGASDHAAGSGAEGQGAPGAAEGSGKLEDGRTHRCDSRAFWPVGAAQGGAGGGGAGGDVCGGLSARAFSGAAGVAVRAVWVRAPQPLELSGGDQTAP